MMIMDTHRKHYRCVRAYLRFQARHDRIAFDGIASPYTLLLPRRCGKCPSLPHQIVSQGLCSQAAPLNINGMR